MANWGGAEHIIWKVSQYLMKTGEYDITVIGLIDEQPSFEKEFQSIGIKTHSLNVSDKRSILLQLPKLFSLYKMLKKEKPDILMNVLFPSILTGGIIGKLAGIKHIIGNLHGPAVFKKRIAVQLDRFVSRYYEGYIAVAEHIKTQFSKREKYPAEKITVIPNGLEEKPLPENYDRSKFRQELGIGNSDIVIGTVGRIYKEKNQAYLIDIAKKLLNKIPNLKVLIVGDGPKFKDLKEHIKKNEMEQHCVLAGWQKEPTPYLKAMDLFVLPSHYEGMPCSILEAWQQKVPVAGTDVFGINELINDSNNGILIPKNDTVKAADLISAILKDQRRADTLSENGYAKWQNDFLVETMSERHHKYFKIITTK
jgi:glycosyltransferase involved in cell wall biosynthesis